MSARDRIMGRVKSAVVALPPQEHPGAFGAWRPIGPVGTPVDALQTLLEEAGATLVRVDDATAAAAWLADFERSFETATVGETVPEALRPSRVLAPPDRAALGVSMARAAIAETGSLMMDARDGRRSQLLAPTHVVFVRASTVVPTFAAALASVRSDLPSAIGLHSGPSKSADIGQMMVKGVHGPGRLIAVVFG